MTAGSAPAYSKTLPGLISNAKILLVGAGGIGCEVLKNLVLSGFLYIEVVDLDTIDVSNLNRQFLFRKEHVGKSKAEVARESVLLYNPDCKITAHHASVISPDFGVNFIKNFDVVLNALDNRAARNQVNRVCLAANVPLVESGTSGYLGQVELILKDKTKCYECEPKAPPKTFPGCTIRNTPSEHVHCIVWSKHLFNQLFGVADEDEEVSPDVLDPEAGANGKIQVKETTAGNVERVSTRKWAESTGYDPEKIFNKLFRDDIGYLLAMSDLWTKRTPPVPLSYADALKMDEGVETNVSRDRDTVMWTIKECANVFRDCITLLSDRYKMDGELTWDKDDKAGMDFVTACANIRAHIFKIDKKSRFMTKSVAGNIIPAIATANAIVAGYVVLQTLKVLQNRIDMCQSVYLRRFPNPRGLLVVPEKHLSPPVPTCFVCSEKPEVLVKCNIQNMTCREFESEILKKGLNLPAPDVILADRGTIVISSDEEENECNYSKTLVEIGIADGAILLVDDFIQNFKFQIIISQYSKTNSEDPEFVIVGSLEQARFEEMKNGSEQEAHPNAESDDDDLEVMETEISDDQRRKRKPAEEDAPSTSAASSPKKPRTDSEPSQESSIHI